MSKKCKPRRCPFLSLADPTRHAIVRHLTQGEHLVRYLVDRLSLAQSTVSAHVACLRGCGLVEGRPDGRQTFYSLSRPELIDVLESAEKLLAATGYKVAPCENYGTEKNK